jgi:hypothetical protein
VRRAIVQDYVDLFVCRLFCNYPLQKALQVYPLLDSVNFVLTCPVATSRAANRFSVPCRLGALQPAYYGTAVGLRVAGRSLDGLDAGLLIRAQNHRIQRWVQVEPTISRQKLAKLAVNGNIRSPESFILLSPAVVGSASTPDIN